MFRADLESSTRYDPCPVYFKTAWIWFWSLNRKSVISINTFPSSSAVTVNPQITDVAKDSDTALTSRLSPESAL